MKVKFVKFDENARIPEKAHPSDMGYDVYAVSEREIAPDVWQYGLGFGLQMVRGIGFENIGLRLRRKLNDEPSYGEVDLEGFIRFAADTPINLSIDIRPRSSIWRTGMSLCNSEATIDENYTGEIKLNFYHINKRLERYHIGDKIAQMKLGMAFPIEFVEVDKLDDTDRGGGAFGSSGK